MPDCLRHMTRSLDAVLVLGQLCGIIEMHVRVMARHFGGCDVVEFEKGVVCSSSSRD